MGHTRTNSHQSLPCYVQKNGIKGDAVSQHLRELLWMSRGGSGSGYLSFMAKCVSNPVSCVTLGGSDPPQPADPAVPSLSFNF